MNGGALSPILQFPVVYLVGSNQPIVGLDFGSPDMGRLAYFAGSAMAMFSGATYGLTELSIDVLDADPSFDPDPTWETVEEGSLQVSGGLSLIPHPTQPFSSVREMHEQSLPLPDIADGSYGVRIYARGRDSDRSDVAIRVLMWPTPTPIPTRTIRVGDDFHPESITSVVPTEHPSAGSRVGDTAAAVEVEASYHTFLISAANVDPSDVVGTSTDALVSGSGNVVAVSTVVASGPVRVSLSVVGDDPSSDLDADDWDRVGDVTIASTLPLAVMDLDGTVYDELPTVPPSSTGYCAVRIAARRGAAQWDEVADTAHETFVVQVREVAGPADSAR